MAQEIGQKSNLQSGIKVSFVIISIFRHSKDLIINIIVVIEWILGLH